MYRKTLPNVAASSTLAITQCGLIEGPCTLRKKLKVSTGHGQPLYISYDIYRLHDGQQPHL